MDLDIAKPLPEFGRRNWAADFAGLRIWEA
jgi:hypothetical protein